MLGEIVHPRNVNTLRRIREEDGAVVEEQEQFAELASSDFLRQQLQALLDAGGREALERLPDGIHSSLARADAKGVFFYFTAPARRQFRQLIAERRGQPVAAIISTDDYEKAIGWRCATLHEEGVTTWRKSSLS